jgi:2-polyprenyl-6-methoxyphenol hydroxylase-like FAD-dependent oxidoreductase
VAVVIIGGGVVGLTTANALRQAGVEATVYERVDDVAASQIGAGLGLAYNATRVLRKIGLLDSVEAAGQRIDRFEFRTSKGKLLSYWTVPEGEAHVGITRKRLRCRTRVSSSAGRIRGSSKARALPPQSSRTGRRSGVAC